MFYSESEESSAQYFINIEKISEMIKEQDIDINSDTQISKFLSDDFNFQKKKSWANVFKHLSEIENKRLNFTLQAHSRPPLAIHLCIVAQHDTVTSLSIEINNDKLLCCNLSQRFEPMPVSQLVSDRDAKNNFKKQYNVNLHHSS